MKKNCLEAETKNTKNEVIDESKKLFDFIYQNATVSDFKSKEEKFIIGIDSIGGIDKFKMIEDGLKGDVKADQGTLQKETM